MWSFVKRAAIARQISPAEVVDYDEDKVHGRRALFVGSQRTSCKMQASENNSDRNAHDDNLEKENIDECQRLNNRFMATIETKIS